MVVAVGLAVGLDTVVVLKPVAGNHAYVLPATEAEPIKPLVVEQVSVIPAPALATGVNVFTVTVTALVAVQPLLPLVTVTV